MPSHRLNAMYTRAIVLILSGIAIGCFGLGIIVEHWMDTRVDKHQGEVIQGRFGYRDATYLNR